MVVLWGGLTLEERTHDDKFPVPQPPGHVLNPLHECRTPEYRLTRWLRGRRRARNWSDGKDRFGFVLPDQLAKTRRRDQRAHLVHWLEKAELLRCRPRERI